MRKAFADIDFSAIDIQAAITHMLCSAQDLDNGSTPDGQCEDIDGDNQVDSAYGTNDQDGDGVVDDTDNCPAIYNPEQLDTDANGIGNACSDDDDGDGLSDEEEIAEGSATSPRNPDEDGDNVVDGADNCPTTQNSTQTDIDKNGEGDACDADIDGDGQLNNQDKCDYLARDESNADAHDADANANGVGDACENDSDGDGEPNPTFDEDGDYLSGDNCPNTPNDQTDSDGDNIGDACDDDADGDGAQNTQYDSEGNYLAGDNCPVDKNEDQADTDKDGIGDACDTDADGDEVEDTEDNCPLLSNPAKDGSQSDGDGDGVGDDCDDDKDNDGLRNAVDVCPLLPLYVYENKTNGSKGQFISAINDHQDLDNDGIGNACDDDLDGDAVKNSNLLAGELLDAFPFDPSETTDTDGDGIGDNQDNCVDVPNANQLNTDAGLFGGDSLGDACDNDDDADGIKDFGPDGSGGLVRIDNCPLTPNASQNQAACSAGTHGIDWDGDWVPNEQDNCPLASNINQENRDYDAELAEGRKQVGDACEPVLFVATDEDEDGDGIPAGRDNCELIANPNQANTFDDGPGDACDTDSDQDGIPTFAPDQNGVLTANDTCPYAYNTRPITDSNGDGIDDACQTADFSSDLDGDGLADSEDTCPTMAKGVHDHTDLDGDGLGNACDSDDDGDGLLDIYDIADTNDSNDNANLSSTNPDADGDGVLDGDDNCPVTLNGEDRANQTDTDADGVGDICDEDDDNDGILDIDEVEALSAEDHIEETGKEPSIINLNNSDGDGVPDGRLAPPGSATGVVIDVCPLTQDPLQIDTDGDKIGDACDVDDDGDTLSDEEEARRGTNPLLKDSDGDGFNDDADTCPTKFTETNSDDTDGDGNGDFCDEDDDGDGINDADDPNPLNPDIDDDGVLDGADNCPADENANQSDIDGDKVGDVCDADSDGDGINEQRDEDGNFVAPEDDAYSPEFDNCPHVANADQAKREGSDRGIACETTAEDDNGNVITDGNGDPVYYYDDDGDGVPNDGEQHSAHGTAQTDNCQVNANPATHDHDNDSDTPLRQGDDLDGDGEGDICDADDDGDGVLDGAEADQGTNPRLADTDGDGFNDNRDDAENGDNCPAIANDQTDADEDGKGDSCDDYDDDNQEVQTDWDSDGIENADDNCASHVNPNQADADNDGLGNVCDDDDDNDNVADAEDGLESGLPSCITTATDAENNLIFAGHSGHFSQSVNAEGGKADGEKADFEVFLPREGGVPSINCGKAYPVVLHGPGFSSPKSDSDGSFGSLRDQGFVVVSHSPRGFGESDGTVTVMDPEREGRHILTILNWVEDNLDFIAYDDLNEEGVNPVNALDLERLEQAALDEVNPPEQAELPNFNMLLGAVGGSYGGGYQFLLLAVDKAQRLDAMVPDITWHDLRYSLNPGNIAKAAWDLLLVAGGETSSYGSGAQIGMSEQTPEPFLDSGLDPFIKETLVHYVATGHFPPEALTWFRYHSPSYWCEAQDGQNLGFAGADYFPYQMPPAMVTDVMVTAENEDFYTPSEHGLNGQNGLNGGNLDGVNILLTQGVRDTLFNYNDGIWNYRCLGNAGANVRFLTHESGHVINGYTGGLSSTIGFDDNAQAVGKCGGLDMGQAQKAWLLEHLKGEVGAADDVPEFCLSVTAHTEAVHAEPPTPNYTNASGYDEAFVPQYQPDEVTTLTAIDVGMVPQGAAAVAVFEPDFLNPTGASQFATELLTVKEVFLDPLEQETKELLLAGTAVIDLTVAGPEGQRADCSASDYAAGQQAGVGGMLGLGCDAAIFVGFSGTDGKELIDGQIVPIRRLGTHRLELNGVIHKLAKEDKLHLMVYGWHPQFLAGPTRDVTLPAVSVTVNELQLPLFVVAKKDVNDEEVHTLVPGNEANRLCSAYDGYTDEACGETPPEPEGCNIANPLTYQACFEDCTGGGDCPIPPSQDDIAGVLTQYCDNPSNPDQSCFLNALTGIAGGGICEDGQDPMADMCIPLSIVTDVLFANCDDPSDPDQSCLINALIGDGEGSPADNLSVLGEAIVAGLEALNGAGGDAGDFDTLSDGANALLNTVLGNLPADPGIELPSVPDFEAVLNAIRAVTNLEPVIRITLPPQFQPLVDGIALLDGGVPTSMGASTRTAQAQSESQTQLCLGLVRDDNPTGRNLAPISCEGLPPVDYEPEDPENPDGTAYDNVVLDLDLDPTDGDGYDTFQDFLNDGCGTPAQDVLVILGAECGPSSPGSGTGVPEPIASNGCPDEHTAAAGGEVDPAACFAEFMGNIPTGP